MTAKKAIEREIGRYLEEVAARLGEMPADEKDDVLRDIESHIYAALENCGPNPTADDLNVILAGMDRPSAWAESARAGDSAPRGTPPSPPAGLPQSAARPAVPAPGSPIASKPRFSGTAIAAGILTPIGLLLMIPMCFLASKIALSSHSPFGSAFYSSQLGLAPQHIQPVQLHGASYGALSLLFFCAPGIVFAVAGTVLALAALSNIRASKGSLKGLPLAVGCAVVFPVLIGDLFIITLARTATTTILGYSRHYREFDVATVVVAAVVTLVLVLWFSIWLFKATWRWANRPLQSGEFT